MQINSCIRGVRFLHLAAPLKIMELNIGLWCL